MTEPLNPEQLRSFTPLNVLSEQQWRELRPQLVPQHLLAGQLLFRQGDQARTTYYLLSGELLLRDAAGGEERLQAGSEASCHPLSPSLPRQHEARALTDVSVLALDSTDLDGLLTRRLAYQDLLLDLGDGGEDGEGDLVPPRGKTPHLLVLLCILQDAVILPDESINRIKVVDQSGRVRVIMDDPDKQPPPPARARADDN